MTVVRSEFLYRALLVLNRKGEVDELEKKESK